MEVHPSSKNSVVLNLVFLLQMPPFICMHLNFRELATRTHKEIHSLEENQASRILGDSL